MGALATAVAVTALTRPELVVPAVGMTVLLLAAVRQVWWPPPPRSRWWRGWWALALAVGPVTAAWTPDLASDRLRPAFGLVAGLAVLAGATAALRSRDVARSRSLVIEAGLAGVLVAYLAAAVLAIASGGGGGPDLVALAGEAAALWALLSLLRRERDAVTRAERRLTVAVAGLVAARLVDVLGGLILEVDLLPVAAALTAAALVVWGAALCTAELRDAGPTFATSDDVLDLGHVGLVVGGVLAGPVAIVAHVALRGVDGLVVLAAAGGLLGLLAVLHLLQLVHDHGRRAWRARHDALTSLPTEPLFEDRLEQAMARARRAGTGLAVGFVDLDGFKRVNDRDGHEAGDEVLCAVALRLRGALREEDTVARKSGDEFLVLLPGVDAPADAERVASKLLAALEPPIDVGGHQYRIGASIGLALWPRDGTSTEELIRHADAAMYEVKESRRGSLRWYTTSTTARTRLRLTLAHQLETALAVTDQIQLAYQPRVDLRDGRVAGLVALVRWRHPELGLLTPRSFLPIAAEAGLTADLDLYVLEQACSEVARLRADGLLDTPVTVHLSDRHLAHPRLEDDVVGALRRSGLRCDRLVLSVTEGGLERGAEPALRTLHDLGEIGVRTMLARFGTGPVSLATLANLPPATVEIASAHLADAAGGPSTVIDAALALARRFGLEPSANGVTSEAQVAQLRESGCSLARGPHLAPPLLGETLAARLALLARGEEEHDPTTVPVAHLLVSTEVAEPERPELAAVLAAAVRVDTEVDERDLTDVLALLGDPQSTRPVTA